MIRTKLQILLICCLFSSISSNAQSLVNTEYKNTKQLPVAQVFRTFQDSEGFLWYGTQGGGLCRDDGYSVKIFRSDCNTPDLLESNWITCISEDLHHKIWFGTKRGLYVLDKTTYEIHQIKDPDIQNWSIDALWASTEGNIWVSTADLVIKYDLFEKKLDTYHSLWKGESKSVSQIYEDRDKNIWTVQWRGGIHKYNPATNEFVPIPWEFEESPTSIIQDTDLKKYWISTWGQGIVEFNPNNTGEPCFTLHNSTKGNRDDSKRYILNLTTDTVLNYIWAATVDNIYAYSKSQDRQLTNINIDKYLPSGKLLVNQIITDKQGNLKISTDYPHSFTLSFRQKNFLAESINQDVNTFGLPIAPVVFSNNKNNYWFWQKRQGLFLYNTKIGKLISLSELPGLNGRKKSILIKKATDDDGIYTVLDDTVVVKLHPSGAGNVTLENVIEIPSSERIHSLSQDQKHNLLIGTQNTLFYYNFAIGKLTKSSINVGVINDITTSNGLVFLATEQSGLCMIDTTGSIHEIVMDKNFSSIANASNRFIWSGTEQGEVFIYDILNNKTSQIKELLGLNGDAIIDLEVDSSGLIWILTNQKVIIHNPEQKTTNSYYSSEPDISMNNFYSLGKDAKGQIIISGMDGFRRFVSHSSLKNESKTQHVKLTSYSINGNHKLVGIENNRIELQPNERNLVLNFSTFDHLHTGKIRFAYRFKNQHSNWQYLPDGINSLSLTGLSKGLYQLEVHATNATGQWSNQISLFTLKVLPYWYESIIAFIIYLLLLIAFIVLSIHIYLNRKKQKLANEQIRNSALDLRDWLYQLSGEMVSSESSEPNLKSLLLDIKKQLQNQKTENKGDEQQGFISNISASDEKFIQKALHFVESNIDSTNYSVEQLSKDLGMDRTGLYRKLISIMGKSPTDLIKSTRLNRAKKLLKGGYTVSETADLVGFGTASYFSKCFKDEFGVKPSRYTDNQNNT